MIESNMLFPLDGYFESVKDGNIIFQKRRGNNVVYADSGGGQTSKKKMA